MDINGLKLPSLLEADLKLGRRTLDEAERACLFRLLSKIEKPLPSLYDLRGVEGANQLWTSVHAPYYLGSPSIVYKPGDIDPKRALIFGHAEPDSPIALDYRTEPPRVLYLGGIDYKSYWVELAPSYEDLIAELRK